MSGNQYVYSIEIYQGAVVALDLVAKNRKAIRARVARLISNRQRTHEVVRSFSHRDLTLLVFTHGGTHAVCEQHLLRPREGYRSTTSIEVTVKAWVIKDAKPEGPVRGTLKERMGDRAWHPSIMLDEPPPDTYPPPLPDGQVTKPDDNDITISALDYSKKEVREVDVFVTDNPTPEEEW